MRRTSNRAATVAAGLAVTAGMLAAAAHPGPAAAADGHQLQVTASDVLLDAGYWQGGTEGAVTIEVADTGAQHEDVEGTVILPKGTRLLALTAADGCTAGTGTAFTCSLDAGARPGRATVRLVVEPDAWRHAPLVGIATASAPASGVADSDGYAVVLPAGPPDAGVALAAADVVLPPARDGVLADQRLEVRMTPQQQAEGVVEVVTPPGVSVQRLPGACRSGSRTAVNRERCELGMLPAGQELELVFGLHVSPQALAEAPLGGAVLCHLDRAGQSQQAQPEPSGSARQDDRVLPATAQVSYRVLAAAGAASPAASGSGGGAGQGTEDGSYLDLDDQPTGVTPVALGGGRFAGGQVSAGLVIGIATGLVAVVGFLVLVSLRRRMRDDLVSPAPQDGGGE